MGYPTHGTLGHPKTDPDYTYGAITLSGVPFQGTSAFPDLFCTGAHTPHLCIRFTLCRFRSPLLTASKQTDVDKIYIHLFFLSFPAGTKMFQFPAFPILSDRPLKKDRKSHSGISGSRAAYASPELFAAGHALLRLPSQAIHQMTLA